ncbi:hypothetical protein [Dongia sp.]|uniref:hypothetical protein n=1 Tax=Dongia sp. TaxID=1977262 RepID=UPI0035B45867
MSISDPQVPGVEFEDWIVQEFADQGSFTALIILVEIGDVAVLPVASTYLNVIGDEIVWLEVLALFAGAPATWNGACFFPVAAPEGGPLDNAAARDRLREIELRISDNLLFLNEGHFFNREGRRLMIEEASAG